eukprot:693636-Rhodomonas_salina.1
MMLPAKDLFPLDAHGVRRNIKRFFIAISYALPSYALPLPSYDISYALPLPSYAISYALPPYMPAMPCPVQLLLYCSMTLWGSGVCTARVFVPGWTVCTGELVLSRSTVPQDESASLSVRCKHLQ